MIVDMHTHWDSCHGVTAEDWLKTFDRYGVTHVLVMPTQGLFDSSLILRDNDGVAAACNDFPRRMLPCCTVSPWRGKEAVSEFRRCLDVHRVRGLKIHPWVQGCSPSWPQMDELCELAAEFDVPVLFHDGTPCFSLPSQMALLAERHPKTNVVLGHCGLLEHWREAVSALNSTDNLWGCLCGPHLAGMREIVSRCDNGRLLWGSDQGFSRNDLVGYRLGVLQELGLDDRIMQAILADNPARLLKLRAEPSDAVFAHLDAGIPRPKMLTPAKSPQSGAKS